jgi:hypothetical protein
MIIAQNETKKGIRKNIKWIVFDSNRKYTVKLNKHNLKAGAANAT